MIEWFEKLIGEHNPNIKSVEEILINKINDYKSKTKYSRKIQDTNETVDRLEAIEWFLLLARKLK